MTRSMKAAAVVAVVASIGGLLAIVAIGAQPWTVVITGPAGNQTTYRGVSADTQAEAQNAAWALHRQHFTVVATADGPPPTGQGYPSVAQIDFDGDFDPGCRTVGGAGGWVNDYTTGTRKEVLPTGAGEGQCWVKITDTSSGSGTRGELGSGSRPAGGEYTYEFLLWVPANVNFVGFVGQTKLDEIAGSCANGGWGMPQDQNGRLMLRVRSDCDADYRDLDFGNPPRDRWIALWAHQTFRNSGGIAEARMDPDGPGPLPYGPIKSVAGDTTSGGSVKFRIGRYGTGTSGQWIGVDGYHLNVH